MDDRDMLLEYKYVYMSSLIIYNDVLFVFFILFYIFIKGRNIFF